VIRNGQGLCAPQSPSKRSASIGSDFGRDDGYGESAWHVGAAAPPAGARLAVWGQAEQQAEEDVAAIRNTQSESANTKKNAICHLRNCLAACRVLPACGTHCHPPSGPPTSPGGRGPALAMPFPLMGGCARCVYYSACEGPPKKIDGPPPVHLLNPGPAHPPSDFFCLVFC
jgi:hypothetical protein